MRPLASAPFLERTTSLNEQDLESLPYGVVVIDNRGTIVSFKRAESMVQGIARAKVLGRNFFHEIAPLFAQVATFGERFKHFLEEDVREIEPFEFVFPFATGAQRVSMLFVRDDVRRNRISIFVSRAEVPQ